MSELCFNLVSDKATSDCFHNMGKSDNVDQCEAAQREIQF